VIAITVQTWSFSAFNIVIAHARCHVQALCVRAHGARNAKVCGRTVRALTVVTKEDAGPAAAAHVLVPEFTRLARSDLSSSIIVSPVGNGA
jgi:hypothetical protein